MWEYCITSKSVLYQYLLHISVKSARLYFPTGSDRLYLYKVGQTILSHNQRSCILLLCRPDCTFPQPVIMYTFIMSTKLYFSTASDDVYFYYVDQAVLFHSQWWCILVLCRPDCTFPQPVMMYTCIMSAKLYFPKASDDVYFYYVDQAVLSHNQRSCILLLCRPDCTFPQPVMMYTCIMSTKLYFSTASDDVYLYYVDQTVLSHNQRSCILLLCRPSCTFPQPVMMYTCIMSTRLYFSTASDHVYLYYVGQTVLSHSQWWCILLLCRPSCTFPQPAIMYTFIMSTKLYFSTASDDVYLYYVDQTVLFHSQWSCILVLCRPNCTFPQPVMMYTFIVSTKLYFPTTSDHVYFYYVDQAVLSHSQRSCILLLCRPSCTFPQPVVMYTCIMSTRLYFPTTSDHVYFYYVDQAVLFHSQWWCILVLCRSDCTFPQPVIMYTCIMSAKLYFPTASDDVYFYYVDQTVLSHNQRSCILLLCRPSCTFPQPAIMYTCIMSTRLYFSTASDHIYLYYVGQTVLSHSQWWCILVLCWPDCTFPVSDHVYLYCVGQTVLSYNQRSCILLLCRPSCTFPQPVMMYTCIMSTRLYFPTTSDHVYFYYVDQAVLFHSQWWWYTCIMSTRLYFSTASDHVYLYYVGQTVLSHSQWWCILVLCWPDCTFPVSDHVYLYCVGQTVLSHNQRSCILLLCRPSCTFPQPVMMYTCIMSTRLYFPTTSDHVYFYYVDQAVLFHSQWWCILVLCRPDCTFPQPVIMYTCIMSAKLYFPTASDDVYLYCVGQTVLFQPVIMYTCIMSTRLYFPTTSDHVYFLLCRPSCTFPQPVMVYTCIMSTRLYFSTASDHVYLYYVDQAVLFHSQWSCILVLCRPDCTFPQPAIMYTFIMSTKLYFSTASDGVYLYYVDQTVLFHSQWSCILVLCRPSCTFPQPVIMYTCIMSTRLYFPTTSDHVYFYYVDQAVLFHSQWWCILVLCRPDCTFPQPVIMYTCIMSTKLYFSTASDHVYLYYVDQTVLSHNQRSCILLLCRPSCTFPQPVMVYTCIMSTRLYFSTASDHVYLYYVDQAVLFHSKWSCILVLCRPDCTFPQPAIMYTFIMSTKLYFSTASDDVYLYYVDQAVLFQSQWWCILVLCRPSCTFPQPVIMYTCIMSTRLYFPTTSDHVYFYYVDQAVLFHSQWWCILVLCRPDCTFPQPVIMYTCIMSARLYFPTANDDVYL